MYVVILEVTKKYYYGTPETYTIEDYEKEEEEE